MGISIQQYRISVQTFNQSNIFTYRSSKPKYRKYIIRKSRSNPVMPILLLLCCVVTWTSSCSLNEKPKSHFSQSPTYPSLLCTSSEPGHASGQVRVPGSADDPPDPGGHVRWLQLDVANQKTTSNIQLRKCEFLTKSTNIEDYNFLARYKHGNKRGAGMKICHWNKGSAFLTNSMLEIEQTINEYRPHTGVYIFS